MRFARFAALVAVLGCSLGAQAALANHNRFDLASIGPAGGNGPFNAGVRSISPDGHAIAFETAESLVPQDTDSEYDVYVRTGDSLTLASVGPIGGNGPYGAFGQLSQDGSVVFGTAERLTANDQDTTSDTYRFKDGVTTLLTPQSSSGFSIYGGFTPDGSRLIFYTTDALVPEDTDGTFDLYESSAAGPRLVSTGPGGSSGYAYCFALRFGYSCNEALFSEDGSRILFQSGERLLPEDTDDDLDWYARSGDDLELLTPGAISAGDAQFSADGTRLFFTTADGLDPSDTDGLDDVYELGNGAPKLLTPGTAPSYPPTTGDVRLLKVFQDGAAILVGTDARAVPQDTDLFKDIYLFRNGEPTLISTGPLENTDFFPDVEAYFEGATPDASHVVFRTQEALVPEDTDRQPDLYERFDGTTRLVTTGAKEGCPFEPPYDQCPGGEFQAISRDGLRIFFESGQQLVPEDTDRMDDLYERFARETTLISKGNYAENTYSFCGCYQFSDDGRRVAFNSPAQIVPEDTDNQIDVYVATADEPPSCAGVTASPATLLPANHRFRPVTLAGATDPDGDAVSIRITGVTQDEPTGSAPDAALTASSDRVRLRAERDTKGDGRIYRIAFTATDSFGASCAGTATVGVPRHGGSAVDSAPPAYDSFGS